MYYLNTGNPAILFQQAVDSEIYVDKSMLIEKISKKIRTNDKYICITRPRRFGKTVNANMLAAYFEKESRTKNLFDGLAVSKSEMYEKYLNKYNVIYIDFSRMPDLCKSYEQYIENVISGLKEDLRKQYPLLEKKEYSMLNRMFQDTGDSFIFILDEWDSIFFQSFMTEENRNQYLLFIKNLLKDQPYADLAYMTGVLPITKYSSGSELNMFKEYNFMNDRVYEAYFGLSESEVRDLCKEHNSVSYQELKSWYDGYYMSDGSSLFNPRSVNHALTDGVCRNYWTETGPMNEIADCIEHNADEVREDIVKMVAGIPVEVELEGYGAASPELNTRDEILSAMVVYGFLSYHDGCLRIPNHELMEKYQRVLSRDSMGEVKEIISRSKEMMEATVAGNEKKVADLLEAAHDKEIPFLKYGDENSLSCLITLCYLYGRKDYIIEREAKSGKGYCDYLFLPRKAGKPAIILELKAGREPQEAINQIKEKHYIQKVEKYKEIILVGISYDEKKRHQCRIEKIQTPQ